MESGEAGLLQPGAVVGNETHTWDSFHSCRTACGASAGPLERFLPSRWLSGSETLIARLLPWVHGVSPGKTAGGPEPFPDDGSLSRRYSKEPERHSWHLRRASNTRAPPPSPQHKPRCKEAWWTLSYRWGNWGSELKSNLLQDTQHLRWDGKWAHF